MKRSCILDKRVCKVFSASIIACYGVHILCVISWNVKFQMHLLTCPSYWKNCYVYMYKKNFDPVIQMRRYSSTVSPIFLRTRFWIFTSFYKFKQCSTVYLTLNITVFNVSNQVRRIGHCLSCVKDLQKLFIYT